MQKHRRSKTGFTLIELLIVMVIISLLAAFVAPRFFDPRIAAADHGIARIWRDRSRMSDTAPAKAR